MKDKITVKLKKDIKKYEKKLKLRPLYNTGSIAIKTILKYGIFVDYALPYIASGFILAYAGNKFLDNLPFHKDIVLRRMNIETIDSSFGYHSEKETIDDIKYEKRIEYSTAWSINEDGMYTRTVTHFKLNHNIDLSRLDLIFSLSDDDLRKLFRVDKVEEITKEYLEAEDYIYSEDALFVVNNYKSDELYQRYENDDENASLSMIYLAMVLLTGYGYSVVSHMYIKTPIRNKLKQLDSYVQPIEKNDIEVIKNIIELKKQNLSLFEENNNDDNKEFQLRRR